MEKGQIQSELFTRVEAGVLGRSPITHRDLDPGLSPVSTAPPGRPPPAKHKPTQCQLLLFLCQGKSKHVDSGLWGSRKGKIPKSL